jgi:hypothetical protein
LYYKREGDYYIPLFKLPESPKIGIWGKRRQDYLKTHRHLLYDRLIKEFASAEGITEDLKVTNQME